MLSLHWASLRRRRREATEYDAIIPFMRPLRKEEKRDEKKEQEEKKQEEEVVRIMGREKEGRGLEEDCGRYTLRVSNI